MNMKTSHSNRGFTLLEVLVATIIFGLMMTCLTAFLMQCLNSLNGSEQRMTLATEIKKFSNEMILQGSRSNQFILYKTATYADFDGVNTPPYADPNYPDRQAIVSGTPPLHPAGDFVVFVYFEFPKPTNDASGNPLTVHRISKLEGYYLTNTNSQGIGQVNKLIIDFTNNPTTGGAMLAGVTGPTTASVETILKAMWKTSSATWDTTLPGVKVTTYFPMVRGLAVPEVIDGTPVSSPPAPTPRLFYESADRNVIISGQIYSGNKNINTNDRRTYTNAFCFNITPRT